MASQYETSVVIPSFSGLNQAGDGYNQTLRQAREMENVDTTSGMFRPMREGRQLPYGLPYPIGTLACLSRRFGFPDNEKTVLVAMAGGNVYTRPLNKNEDWTVRYTGLSKDLNSYVTYEVNVEGHDPIDVLLFSNNTDGMFCLYGDDLHVAAVTTPYRFGVISRFNERIWGTDIIGAPESLVYSAPFDPFDWDQNDETPEDGGGEIMAPSWDGDRFVAMRQFGSQLLCFKRNAIWRVLGTDPGEFVVREQHGQSTVSENTIAILNSLVFMLGWGGIVRYDGAQSTAFLQEMVHDVMDRVNFGSVDAACAIMSGSKYCLALPLDGSTTNNAVLIYNGHEGTFNFRTGIPVKAFLGVDDRVFYTSATTPGRIFELCDEGKSLPIVWRSGYQDLGIKSSVKSGFTVYFLAEAKTIFPLYIGIRTDKKLKMKRLLVKPGKATKTRLNVQGRYFRLEIASDSVIPFAVSGGFKIDMELDPD